MQAYKPNLPQNSLSGQTDIKKIILAGKQKTALTLQQHLREATYNHPNSETLKLLYLDACRAYADAANALAIHVSEQKRANR